MVGEGGGQDQAHDRPGVDVDGELEAPILVGNRVLGIPGLPHLRAVQKYQWQVRHELAGGRVLRRSADAHLGPSVTLAGQAGVGHAHDLAHVERSGILDLVRVVVGRPDGDGVQTLDQVAEGVIGGARNGDPFPAVQLDLVTHGGRVGILAHPFHQYAQGVDGAVGVDHRSFDLLGVNAQFGGDADHRPVGVPGVHVVARPADQVPADPAHRVPDEGPAVHVIDGVRVRGTGHLDLLDRGAVVPQQQVMA
ncbi:hypothetical protein DSECCO2_630770 [anaerobic digester metagenome]